MTRCTGPGCRQGHAPCPTPEACRLPEGTRALAAAFFWPAVTVIAALVGLIVEVMWKQ